MIKNYLLITLRSLFKNKLYIFINVVGMGIAIACCISVGVAGILSMLGPEARDMFNSILTPVPGP